MATGPRRITRFPKEGKVCPKCGVYKVRVDFGERSNVDAMESYCKACVKAARKPAILTPEYARRHHLKHRYGITPEQYEEMLGKQGGGCAVCGTRFPGGNSTNFHVDHCHKTGRVRGLLCRKCNHALGLVDDDPELLRALADYL